jgi:hypothetical protein
MPRIAGFGLIAILLLPAASFAANDLGVICGEVRDSGGIPVVGALVIVAVAASPELPERMAFTDKRGLFSIANLFAGEYSIKVTMPTFLPAIRNGIQLNSGGSTILTVSLQNALDIFRRVLSRDKSVAEDVVWTLRSARSTQPILRLTEAQAQESTPATPGPDYTGYFQVYSKSVETTSGPSEGVGSQFSVTMPFDTGSRVTVAGQYSEIPNQPRGFGALYEFSPAGRHRATIGVNLRQGALFADPLQTGSLKEVQLEYGEQFQFSDHLVFNYGAEVGRTDSVTDRSYLRPRFGIAWVPEARTTLSVETSSQAPNAEDDPIRGKEYFDRTIYVPPALESYSHTEAALSHILSETVEFSAAVFRDRTDTQAVFVGTPEGRRSLLILDMQRSPSQGFRLHLTRRFRNFETGLGFTAAGGLGIDGAGTDIDKLSSQLVPKRFQIVTARLKTDVDATQTEITAVYRWMSGFSVSRIDAYQRLFEYNDPTLSLTIAQSLPTWRMFPGKVQAILDARNLFEQSFGPQRTQVAQYPRLVKGGINIRF